MSSNLVSNVTITGNLLVQGTFSNVASLNTGALSATFFVQGRVPETFKIAGGWSYTAVILADGTVRTIGRNAEGQLGINVSGGTRSTPVQVTGLTSATAVACGRYITAVILADGTVRTFGLNDYGQLGINSSGGTRQTPVQVFGISSSATAVACGWFHMAVLLADGTVRTFGRNTNGGLGVNNTTDSLVPVQVWGISSSATAVACGSYHTAVLLADGTVRTFGNNGQGRLGDNTTTQRLTPVQVFGISSSATAVTCGAYHTAVLLADGTVRTFGDNQLGQLGINSSGDFRLTPVQVFGISSSATAVAGGFRYTAVLLADGTVRTFGYNFSGQLGVNNTTDSLIPVQVWGISSSATAVAGGRYNTAVLLADGTVRTFGANGSGQLGVSDILDRLTPVPVVSTANILSRSVVACSLYHTAILLSDGTVSTFGKNDQGQLGINVVGGTRSTPVQVFGISSSATAVACGFYHTLVLLADRTVRAFGRGNNGQLGSGSTTGARPTPIQVINISTATAVAAGRGFYSAVLLADGTVRTFGSNSSGQLGIDVSGGEYPTPSQVLNISTATAIAAGNTHTGVVLADGTVRTVGANDYGQLGIGVTGGTRQTPVQVLNISTATAVACGQLHTAVLLSDGTVRTFGDNANGGALGIGVNGGSRETPVQVLYITSATAVACTGMFTAVVLADGTVRTFGRNNFGAIGNNGTSGETAPVQVWGISSSATAVAGGSYHTAVILQDGSARTFGYNIYSQLGIGSTLNKLTPVPVLNISTAAALSLITLTSAAAATSTYPYVQFPALNLGPVASPTYQLELSTDNARKLTTSTWTIGSDERLKTDIETANVDRCVEIVQNLDLKRFAWNFPDGSQPPDTHSLGWIAQEFAQFFPNSVDEAPAHGIMDFKNLNSDQIIKVMWGALKKLRADLKSQKSSDSELSTAGDNASPTPE